MRRGNAFKDTGESMSSKNGERSKNRGSNYREPHNCQRQAIVGHPRGRIVSVIACYQAEYLGVISRPPGYVLRVSPNILPFVADHAVPALI